MHFLISWTLLGLGSDRSCEIPKGCGCDGQRWMSCAGGQRDMSFTNATLGESSSYIFPLSKKSELRLVVLTQACKFRQLFFSLGWAENGTKILAAPSKLGMGGKERGAALEREVGVVRWHPSPCPHPQKWVNHSSWNSLSKNKEDWRPGNLS